MRWSKNFRDESPTLFFFNLLCLQDSISDVIEIKSNITYFYDYFKGVLEEKRNISMRYPYSNITHTVEIEYVNLINKIIANSLKELEVEYGYYSQIIEIVKKYPKIPY